MMDKKDTIRAMLDKKKVRHRNKPAADGPRYKSLGNSMATPVMNFIGRRINDAIIKLGD